MSKLNQFWNHQKPGEKAIPLVLEFKLLKRSLKLIKKKRSYKDHWVSIWSISLSLSEAAAYVNATKQYMASTALRAPTRPRNSPSDTADVAIHAG